MAIEFCSEKSADIRVSPRISFSYDFCQSDIVVPAVSEQEQQHPPRSSSNIEFDFCVRESFELESSSADELFSDGKILPTEIKKKITTTATTTASSGSPRQQVVLDQQQEQVVVIPQPPLPPPPPPQARPLPDDDDGDDNNNSKSLKKDNEGDDKQSSKSFWRFKRSSSCGNGYGRRSLCPLPLLSRSNSTGSADSTPISKRSSSLSSKDVRHSSQRNLRLSSAQSSSSSSSNSYQKPPLLKKSGHHHHHHHGSYTNGVSINPVLNVPPANLFGLGSIFSNGKEKGKKK